jgi:hypothetical protein
MSTPAAPTTPDTAVTSYVILSSADGTMFEEVGTASGSSGNAAIRQFLAGKPEVDSTFCAIPARSWKPVQVKTRVGLSFGGES